MNSKRQNIEFQITFTENNIRFLYGEKNPNMDLIRCHEETVERLKTELEALDNSAAKV